MSNTIQSTLTQQGTPGTLGSTSMYINPNVPRNSQAPGLQGTDNRGYTRTVGQNELVENRLARMLGDPNSAYLNQARNDARMYAQSRGLGNSSIAAGAGARAAIQSGLPIASQDAQTMSNAQAQNMDAMNSNLMQEREIQNAMLEGAQNRDMQGSIQLAQLSQAERAEQMRLQMQRENLAYQGEQAGLGRAHDFSTMAQQFGLQDMFANNQLGRDVSQMGAEYNFRDQFANNDAMRQDWRARNDAENQDWLANNQFNRAFYGDMAGAAFGTQLGSVSDFFSMINNYALNNPDVFNAQDYTNFSNFANQAMGSVFNNIFAGLFGGQGGGG